MTDAPTTEADPVPASSDGVLGGFCIKGSVALVTGGAAGIGAGIARALAGMGAHVVIGDVQEDAGAALAAEVTATGGVMAFQKLDVTSEHDWNAATKAIADRFGHLDILVNNAGILLRGGVEQTSLEDFRRVVDISEVGAFLGMKTCLPLLRQRRDPVPSASIVNVSSIGGLRGAPGAFAYGASRAALISMTKSAALEFANRGYAVRVNAVLPGSVQTQLSEQTYAELMGRGMTRADAIRHMTGLHPLGRLGTTDDIAGAVIYLSSPAASWITGTTLTVDGGRTA